MPFGVTFAQTEIFVSQFRRLQLDDEDLQSLERMLAETWESDAPHGRCSKNQVRTTVASPWQTRFVARLLRLVSGLLPDRDVFDLHKEREGHSHPRRREGLPYDGQQDEGIAREVATMRKRPRHRKFGKQLLASMEQMAEALESGNLSRLTVRNVQLPEDPSSYDARRVRETRDRLNVSQLVFARLLGVSVVLSQSWEQGVRKPSKLACRLLDEINANPDYWRRKLTAA
jgi:putative transcriptional regulator